VIKAVTTLKAVLSAGVILAILWSMDINVRIPMSAQLVVITALNSVVILLEHILVVVVVVMSLLLTIILVMILTRVLVPHNVAL